MNQTMMKQSFIARAKTLAHVMTRSCNVKVTVSGDTAYNTSGLINIPAGDFTDKEWLKMVTGWIDHELGHEKHTNDASYAAFARKGHLHRHLLNIVEDVWMERAVGREFPGARQNLATLAELAVKRELFQNPANSKHPLSAVTSFLLYGGRAKIIGQHCLDDYADIALAEVEKHFGDEFAIKLAAIRDDIDAVNSTAGAVKIAQSVIDLLKEEKDKQEEQQQQQQQNQAGDSDDDADANSDDSQAGDSDDDADADSDDSQAGESDDDADTDSDDSQAGDSDDDVEADSDDGQAGDSDDDADADSDDSQAGDSDDDADADSDDSQAGESDDEADADSDGDQSGDSDDDADADSDDSQSGDSEDEADADSDGDQAGDSDDDADADSDDSQSGDSEDEADADSDGDQSGDSDDDADSDGDHAGDSTGSGKPSPQQIIEAIEKALNEAEKADIQDFHDALAEMLGEQAEEAHKDEEVQDIASQLQLNAVKGDVSDFVSGSHMLDQLTAKRLSGGVYQTMHKVLFDQVQSLETTRKVGTRLVNRRLSGIPAGNLSVFLRRAETQDVSAAVSVIVDSSISMGYSNTGPIAMPFANACAYAFALGLNKSGVASEFVYYGANDGHSHLMYTAKSFTEKPVASRFGVKASGNTPTGPAIQYALSSLMLRPEQKKMLMVLTDGEPNCSMSVRQATTLAKAFGVKVIPIGIQTTCVEGFDEGEFVTMQDPAELTSALRQAVRLKLFN